MKKLLTLSAILIMSVGFSQNYTESFTASQFNDFESFSDYAPNTSEVDAFGFTVNAEDGAVTFNAPEKIDLINIYNSDHQEIFSAKGSIIKNGKINLAFLPAGTYYLELVIGKNMGSQKLMVQ